MIRNIIEYLFVLVPFLIISANVFENPNYLPAIAWSFVFYAFIVRFGFFRSPKNDRIFDGWVALTLVTIAFFQYSVYLSNMITLNGLLVNWAVTLFFILSYNRIK